MLGPAGATRCKRLNPNGLGVKIFSGKKLAAGLAVLGRFSATSYELRAASFQLPGSSFRAEDDEGVHLPFCSGARVGGLRARVLESLERLSVEVCGRGWRPKGPVQF